MQAFMGKTPKAPFLIEGRGDGQGVRPTAGERLLAPACASRDNRECGESQSPSGGIWADIQRIRAEAPVVHNITNYVVMNTTANALLARNSIRIMRLQRIATW